ncbi:uronyl 2-sulfotransferase-like [Saccoglossus kowalevskii]
MTITTHVKTERLRDIRLFVVAEEENLVVYNRVPKCGSRSVIAIFNELAKFYHYGYTHSTEFWKQRFNEHDEAALVDRISALPKPRVFDMHVHFLNFSKTYDECVLLNKTECQLERAWYIIPFFCGQDPRCRQPLKWSLEEAKRHVINEYTFVGILEDLENTMRIFEYLLPKYLKGAVSILKSLDKRKHLMKSLKQPGVLPSENVTRLMRARLTLEYEFYDFVVERFNRTKQELGLS